MSLKRVLAVSAVAMGLMASNATLIATAATAAQQEPGRKPEGRHHGGPAARPAPQAHRPAPPLARASRPQYTAPTPRHFAPPPVRHAAPAPRPHHDGPRRGWGWRPWGYGAAAAGAVIVGSAIIRAQPSDAEACANDFESFEWESGTIINSDGERQLCPYLE